MPFDPPTPRTFVPTLPPPPPPQPSAGPSLPTGPFVAPGLPPVMQPRPLVFQPVVPTPVRHRRSTGAFVARVMVVGVVLAAMAVAGVVVVRAVHKSTTIAAPARTDDPFAGITPTTLFPPASVVVPPTLVVAPVGSETITEGRVVVVVPGKTTRKEMSAAGSSGGLQVVHSYQDNQQMLVVTVNELPVSAEGSEAAMAQLAMNSGAKAANGQVTGSHDLPSKLGKAFEYDVAVPGVGTFHARILVAGTTAVIVLGMAVGGGDAPSVAVAWASITIDGKPAT